jgi:hypothetical protein
VLANAEELRYSLSTFMLYLRSALLSVLKAFLCIVLRFLAVAVVNKRSLLRRFSSSSLACAESASNYNDFLMTLL